MNVLIMNEPIEINISKSPDKKVERPWGTYEIITKGNGFQVKRLILIQTLDYLFNGIDIEMKLG